MKRHTLRNTLITAIAGYYLLWFVGGMLDFLMFPANDMAVRACSYIGLILCVEIVLCSYWIIRELKK